MIFFDDEEFLLAEIGKNPLGNRRRNSFYRGDDKGDGIKIMQSIHCKFFEIMQCIDINIKTEKHRVMVKVVEKATISISVIPLFYMFLVRLRFLHQV